uniref:Pancreatic trypsin inhibitor n=1 Tax=Rhipicephalus appendiculatus TaxID=34631 RepID=A0A131YPP2_RHIAP
MSPTTLILCGAIISVALETAMSCGKCCGVCQAPSCVKTRKTDQTTHSSKKHFFKEGGQCQEVQYYGCKGWFYGTKDDCDRCCKG